MVLSDSSLWGWFGGGYFLQKNFNAKKKFRRVSSWIFLPDDTQKMVLAEKTENK